MSADALPPAAVAAINLGFDLERAGRYDDAIATLRAGLERFPDLADLQWRLALLLLREGEFEEGWRLYERRPINMGGRPGGKPLLRMPEWDGRHVRTLLILQEQGAAEQIMFARYAPWIRERGTQVSILCHPSLTRLFARLGPGVTVIPGQGRVELPLVDAWALGPSLPGRTGEIPSVPYLRAAAGGSGVGLVAQAGPQPDPARDLPAEIAADLVAQPGMRRIEPATDLEDVAAQIEQVETLVTVDGVAAHIAGAMGKRTILLLPFVADWRWMRDRTDSPWYPSLRLARQASAGDWGAAAAEAKRLLSE